jgi:hypothetical protein
MRKPKDLTSFSQILFHQVEVLFAKKKPGEADEVQSGPKAEHA